MKKVILCVDDEPVILTAVKYQLQRDFENTVLVETAGSAEEALEIINELVINDIELAVVISDQIMPGMKGDEFLTMAQTVSPKSVKILLTGQASMEAIIKSLNKADLYRFISKPWDQLDMELTIREAINLFEKEKTIVNRNKELSELNEDLERKVEERTKQVLEKNNELEASLAKLVSAQRKLVESEKMAALGQLIAGVAHEVNTPLSIINACIGQNISYSQTLLEDLSIVLAILLKQPMEYELFRSLFDQNKVDFMTSKEEREKKRNVMDFFIENKISLDSLCAEYLVDIGLTTSLEKYLPLLNHSRGDLIIKVVHDLSMMRKNRSHIQEAIKKATKIIYALKSYSRINNSENPVEIDLIENIEMVLILYQSLLKQGVDVVRKYPANKVMIKGFPDELNQVWTNLIHNSIQAMENNGTLTIEILALRSTMEVKIGDSGPGIPLEIRDRIFEPFFTTKRVGEGSGLGLDIVKKIIEKHNGSIAVESQLHQGTIFTIALPYLL